MPAHPLDSKLVQEAPLDDVHHGPLTAMAVDR
jgi:hypothetical protein